MAEAQLGDSGSGLGPVSEGWFVVNVRDAHWLTSENGGGDKRTSGAECIFETPMAQFPQFGIRLHVLEPGEPNGLYHAENQQEDFLVLSGECRLLVEGGERTLKAWDFFHAPAGTEHIFVGAGDGPCVILMARLAVGAMGGPLPGVGARRALRRKREGGDGRPGPGVRGLRAVAAGAALVLGPPALGLSPPTPSS